MRHVNPVDLQSETYSRHWWEKYRHEYLPESLIPLPTGKPAKIPRIQHKFPWREGWNAKKVREERREAVKEAFRRSWYAYREHAWMADEYVMLWSLSKRRMNEHGG
jgi:mannosyl-oligosaccharide alpha-1,2-mannosidase